MLIIVSRTEPARLAYLEHVFASEAMEVILDRREGERRRLRLPERAAAERRGGDRRERDITKDLQTHGWAVVRRSR